MGKIIEFYEENEKYFLILSGISLLVSFFDIGNLPIDAAWIAVLVCGLPIIREACIGMITEFDIKADLLVSIALIAAVLLGEIFAAGEIAVIMAIGAMLEDRTVAKARAGIEKLVSLSPLQATRVADGTLEIIPTEEIKEGDRLRILAGETIPADGYIVSGQTSVDQSVITGESLPVDKDINDEVYSGTVNQYGAFDMFSTKNGDNGTLQRMIRLVDSADAEKAKSVRIADRFATWIVIIALSAAALVWFATGEIIRSVTILVVFCPCALVLSTPTAIMAAIGNVTKYGILVREGDALERLAKTKRLFFDKTGTITYGKPDVVKIIRFDETLSEDQFLEIIAAGELNSEHPLGKAIVRDYKTKRNQDPPEPEMFKLLPGKGVLATIFGKDVKIGNEKLFDDFNMTIPKEAEAAIETAIKSGIENEIENKIDTKNGTNSTIIYAAIDGVFSGAIVMTDRIREEISETVEQIEKTDIECVLLTGDNKATANYIGKNAGIKEIHADLLPEDKLIAVKESQTYGFPVCMIGDGVNDAPALKAANVGVAMGKIGSDISIDAADIVLVSDEIQNLPHLLKLSKRMMKTIQINFAFSLILNFIAIILAANGTLNPVMGALVHNLGSILVIINSALLLNWGSRKLKMKKNAAKETLYTK